MYPFIHIGHFSIGTFGLCLWLASVCACWVLYRNFVRYGVDADAVGVAAYTTVGGVVGPSCGMCLRIRRCSSIILRWSCSIAPGLPGSAGCWPASLSWCGKAGRRE